MPTKQNRRRRQQQRQQHYACKKTDFLIAQTTLQASPMILHIFTLEQNKKKVVLDSNLRCRRHRDSSLSVHVLRFLHYPGIVYQIDKNMYRYVGHALAIEMSN